VPLKYRVFLHSYLGFNSNSTLFYGERDAILIDASQLLSDAHKMVAEIILMRKNLTHVYVSHFHPDHHFGLSVLQNAFPSAIIVALPSGRQRRGLHFHRQARYVEHRSLRPRHTDQDHDPHADARASSRVGRPGVAGDVKAADFNIQWQTRLLFPHSSPEWLLPLPGPYGKIFLNPNGVFDGDPPRE
jgi:glyoxylase-like metal-dependent hydrolase (beta-lactamase superfamily II)